MLNCKVIKTNIAEPGCFGVTLLAGSAIKKWSSLKNAAREMISISKTFESDRKINKIYEEFFGLYQKLLFSKMII